MVCPGGSSVVRVAQFGSDFTMPLTAILDDLMCTGEETNLFDCPHPGATVEDCNPPFTDANMICGTLTSGTLHVVVLLLLLLLLLCWCCLRFLGQMASEEPRVLLTNSQ